MPNLPVHCPNAIGGMAGRFPVLVRLPVLVRRCLAACAMPSGTAAGAGLGLICIY
jgi:hypothetical protein